MRNAKIYSEAAGLRMLIHPSGAISADDGLIPLLLLNHSASTNPLKSLEWLGKKPDRLSNAISYSSTCHATDLYRWSTTLLIGNLGS